MKYLKHILIGLVLFLTTFLVGSYLGISSYPKSELNRVVNTTAETMGGFWKFHHRKEVVNSDFKIIVKPAVDFLYSSAGLKASEGAHILRIPAIDRYWVFQFMEEDTDVFAYVGSRTHGMNKSVEVLIVPPNYEGETLGMEVIKMKTNTCWLLARFHVYDSEDAVNVNAIQDKVELIPIEEFKEQLTINNEQLVICGFKLQG